MQKEDNFSIFNGNIISIDSLDNHLILSYDKYDVSDYTTGNSQNGYYERSLHTIFDNITVKIPHD